MVDGLELVRAEWQRRVLAEYRSAAITHALLGWLMRLGASPTLLHAAIRIVDDELVHAEQAFVVLEQAGGGDVQLGDALNIAPPSGPPLLFHVCDVGTRVFCLGETVAVRLFKRLRDGTSIGVARSALDRVLIDEVRHRDFGWLLLEWLAARPEWPELSRYIEQNLPTWLRELRDGYGNPRDVAFTEEARGWGLMPSSDYRAALEETVERDYVPRFAEYEIDALKAWQGLTPAR